MDRRCALREGRCATQLGCKAWESCSDDHTCVVAAGRCTTAADCQAHESCDDTTKRCVLQPNRCNTTADCGSGSLWGVSCAANNQCLDARPPAGNDILLLGTLSEGACYMDAVSSILTPTQVQVGFGCGTVGFKLAPNGRIYYIDRDASPDQLKIFVPDSFKNEKGIRTYPSDPARNDIVIPTPKCGTGNVVEYLMQAGTGGIAYRCADTMNSSREYYTLQGAVLTSAYSPVAWNADDFILAYRDSYTTMFVLTPDRTAIQVTGLPTRPPISISARAHPTGFLFATFDYLQGGPEQLWHIDHQGVATLKGTYGDFPREAPWRTGGILDSEGALYSMSSITSPKFVDLIVKRAFDGSTGTVVYSEASAPEDVNYTSNFTRLFNLIHASTLFSGP
ncbi:hypothetical protein [Corallococcus sp. Z5C101001]|uniref:hypothetical protein n=1 Tax=Corallococcus sp. Z5C101001 TaxID=2596829 RepID=UPI001180BBB4|nr:hypothetical protein [Corallococcus sp. Z5C101001]TSC23218.1 hypothetical protein FOF48_31505 [Corallococcus sp. Z5C101001]